MTKQEEINSLHQYTQSLPADSYLRPWLDSVLGDVAADIRCDFPVSPSLPATRRECTQLLESARLQAQAILDHATQKAEALSKVEHDDRQRRRHQLVRQLRQQITELES